jgi:SAM-dependent methyltransferase
MVGEYFERNDILFRRTEIVDFGAGTGRLSLPLAELGYNVTAVDASEAMLRQLKSRDTEGRVTCVTSPIESYVDPGCHLRGGNGFADLAICFFTVLSYITDRGKLYDALSHMMNTLREDGSMIIECAMPDLFKNKEFQAPGFHRSISFIRVGESAEGQLYDYRDITRYTPAGGPSVRHDESFQLRCWTRETFLELFAELELEIVETRNTPGSIYWTLKHDPGA